LQKIKDGGYFSIEKLADVRDAYLEIYGYLSTICNVNIQLIIQSNFLIDKVYGIEDMYEASLKMNDEHLYIFDVKLIQVVYGKKYKYVILIDVPENTPYGTEILNVTIHPLGTHAKYLWDEKNDTDAYEEYIRCICVTYFSSGYEEGIHNITQSELIIREGLIWIENNYKGKINWEEEFKGVLNDINHFYGFGKANLLSKISELKSSKIGIHYSDENSYQRKIIDQSHNIDVSSLPIMTILEEKIIIIANNINYYYFYLKEGNGEINNLPFFWRWFKFYNIF